MLYLIGIDGKHFSLVDFFWINQVNVSLLLFSGVHGYEMTRFLAVLTLKPACRIDRAISILGITTFTVSDGLEFGNCLLFVWMFVCWCFLDWCYWLVGGPKYVCSDWLPCACWFCGCLIGKLFFLFLTIPPCGRLSILAFELVYFGLQLAYTTCYVLGSCLPILCFPISWSFAWLGHSPVYWCITPVFCKKVLIFHSKQKYVSHMNICCLSRVSTYCKLVVNIVVPVIQTCICLWKSLSQIISWKKLISLWFPALFSIVS